MSARSGRTEAADRTVAKEASRIRTKSETPMMTQYLRVKAEHEDALVLFRMGDFYETFFEDARRLSEVTGVTLTSRNAGDPEPIPLAGFPWHSAETHVKRLLEAGHRVAICEQVEEPGKGKKLLERKVVEVLSPGTAVGDSQLRAGENNFVLAITGDDEVVGFAAADVSTGELVLGDLDLESAREELARIAPAELIVAAEGGERFEPWLASMVRRPFLTRRDGWSFRNDRGRRTLLDHLAVASLDGYECADLGPALGAAGALLEYVREQKQSELRHLRRLRRLRVTDGLVLDDSTLRSLEVVEPMPGSPVQATLVHTLDRTCTSAGARSLRATLRRPFARREPIERRQDGVAALLDPGGREPLREQLRRTSDVERILARLHCDRVTPRDLSALRATLVALPRMIEIVATLEDRSALPDLGRHDLADLRETLERALVDDPPAAVHDGGIFRDEWDAELTEHRSLARDAKSWIARMQEQERTETGIPNLKVGYNKVFGYYLEVTRAHLDKVPETYIRKQTLVGAERFLTPELKEFEQKVMHAEEEETRRERALFGELCTRVREETAGLQDLAEALAELDLLQSFAEVAVRDRYVRPAFTDAPRLSIRDGRHPVVERALGSDRFIPNDVDLDPEDRQLAILTGPNMAGKSTYLRQVGLLVLLAHVGSFVPAEAAEIGVCDRIFTRVGAQDSLAKGQSTFLLEMIETSRILHHATPRSLVLFDEVGRGTSTYDGLAIAWAVAEAIASPAGTRPLTIFATHFHELTRLARELDGAFNLSVQVKEWGDQIVFVRKVVEGGADRSYGIQVARLAGVPDPVIERARDVLRTLEASARRRPGGRSAVAPSSTAQLDLFGAVEPPQMAELRELDLDRLSPLQALELLHRWRGEMDAGTGSQVRVPRAGEERGRGEDPGNGGGTREGNGPENGRQGPNARDAGGGSPR